MAVPVLLFILLLLLFLHSDLELRSLLACDVLDLKLLELAFFFEPSLAGTWVLSALGIHCTRP